MKMHLAGAAVAAITALSGLPAVAMEFITIGTGGVTGVYYPVGGAICRLVNRDRDNHGIRCAVESTDGSVFNVNAIREGELDLGVVQSDIQFKAVNGIDPFEGDAAVPQLRSMFSIHPEPFTLLVREDSGIARFEDIRGKRVNIGNPGSGQRETMEVVMDAFGISVDELALAAEFGGQEMAREICNGSIDAMVYTVGHPAAAIKEATATCHVKLIDVVGEPVDRLLADNPYYRAAVIPGGMYAGNPDDVNTFGVGATLVTSSDLPDETAYLVAWTVMEYLDAFRSLHPAFANLTAREMVEVGLSAPLHPGAERAYKELGLLP